MGREVHTREHLIQLLIPVFQSRGYEGATLTQLAAATGLGKASLYHHFPGGKAEMAETLLRHAVAELQSHAFARLDAPGSATERLQAFLDGMDSYLGQGEGHCTLAMLAQSSLRDLHGERIAAQFRDWQAALARVLEEAGVKPKNAERSAGEVLTTLYGALIVSKLLAEPRHFRRAVKRLRKSLP